MTRERGVYLQESLPENEKVESKLGSPLHPQCIVVYEIDGYNATVIEVVPLPVWFVGMDVRWALDLQRTIHHQDNREVKICQARNFVKVPPADKFHHHLDECERCRTSVLDMCPVGMLLLQQAAAEAIETLGSGVP